MISPCNTCRLLTYSTFPDPMLTMISPYNTCRLLTYSTFPDPMLTMISPYNTCRLLTYSTFPDPMLTMISPYNTCRLLTYSTFPDPMLTMISPCNTCRLLTYSTFPDPMLTMISPYNTCRLLTYSTCPNPDSNLTLQVAWTFASKPPSNAFKEGAPLSTAKRNLSKNRHYLVRFLWTAGGSSGYRFRQRQSSSEFKTLSSRKSCKRQTVPVAAPYMAKRCRKKTPESSSTQNSNWITITPMEPDGMTQQRSTGH